MRLRRTPLDIPILLFFLTLFVSLWLSYSGRLALDKFWMLLTAVLVYYVITAVPRRYAWSLAAVGTVLAVSFTFYYATATYWQHGLGVAGRTLPSLAHLLDLQQFWPLLLPHPNVIAGHIAMLLPFLIAALLRAQQKKQASMSIVTAVCLCIALAGLLLTRSIGAWLALIAGLGIWGLWPISGKVAAYTSLSRRLLYSLGVILLVGCGLTAVWLVINRGLPGGVALAERLALAEGSWRLVQDYAWFGSGLVGFPALYAEYMQVIPNFYLIYSNFYLDVLLELGPVGAICLLAIGVGAFWLIIQALRRSVTRTPRHQGDVYWLRWATLSSLVIILVHGLVDDSLFGGLGTPLLFFTPAVAVVVSRHKTEAELLYFNKRAAWAMAVTLLILGTLLLGFRQRAAANWYAYRGAYLMDHTLFVIWPDNQWRYGRNSAALEPARQQFERALLANSHNRTAHQRLGMMALWQMDIDTAVSHLEEAYAQDPAHRGVIKSLGYAYIWQGQVEKAYPLLTHIPEAGQEMAVYVSYWYEHNQPLLAERAATVATTLNNDP